jgi:hypothetical protein
MTFNIMVGMPGSSFCPASIKAAVEGSRQHKCGFDFSGNGFDDQDILWATALERARKGEITHYVQIHSDIGIEAGGIDVLIEECERLDADLVSAVVPLKDFRNVTSTAVSLPGDCWGGYRRVAGKELPSLPRTFNAADVGYEGFPLLVNTGFFVADLRKPIFQTEENGAAAIEMNFPRKTYLTKDGWRYQRESEDWHFSRCLHRLGARYFATWLPEVRHYNGSIPFVNRPTWGREDHDEETRNLWELGPMTHLDLEGWFDFPDLYKQRVQAVNGKPAHFVEVGSWLGKSAAYMAAEIKRSGKLIRFDAVDNWLGGSNTPDNAGHAISPATRDYVAARGNLFLDWQRNLRACGVEELVVPIRGDSTQCADRYPDNCLDFVFIDADHEAAAVYADLCAWFPKIKPGGILAGHDYDEAGPREAATRFSREKAVNIHQEGRSFVMQS